MNKEPQFGAGAIIVKSGKTLLAKRQGAHAQGTYGSIGGHVEFGESPAETVKREAREELGVEINNLRFLYCLKMIKYDKHYVDIGFLVDIISGEPRIMEPNKIESVDWYPLDNLPQPLFEPVRVAIEAYKTGKIFYDVKE